MTQRILREGIEYIIHCESDGTIIGPISKDHAHMSGVRENLTHYSTWSMIFHKESGKYGIQLKNPKKHDAHTAGKWDMGVAGHNCYFEEDGEYRPLDFNENLIKEAKEEIGLDIQMCESKEEFLDLYTNQSSRSIGYIFDKFHYKTEENNEWVGLGFVIVHDMNVEFSDGEVIDFKWLSPEELQAFIEIENNYCAPLPLVFEKAEEFRNKFFV